MFLEDRKQIAVNKIKSFCGINSSQIKALEDFVILLLKENNKFNLIGESTIADLWNRHILDSAQLMPIIKQSENQKLKIADFGTGAGFPGVILSILGIKEIHLIEKSFRKCEFLRQAKLFSHNHIFIHQNTIEEIENIKFDIIVSRALASIENILEYSEKFLKQNGYFLLLKGKKADEELLEAKKKFSFSCNFFESITSSESKILKISNVVKIS